MLDIYLKNGDICPSETGDITLTESAIQAAKVRLQWFLNEWRLGPMLGLPYFEEVFVKSPNIQKIKKIITDKLLEIDNVDSVVSMDIAVDSKSRHGTINFVISANGEVIEEEVELLG